jgi:caffeoyl-CoA O-methyltransferase
MTTENYLLPDDIHAYCRRVSLREPDILRRLREETARRPDADMQISPELGQLLAFMVGLTGARQILELGTFTGYSALAMALALPEDGRIVACDGNETAHDLARRYWATAGVADKIELRVGECADALAALIGEGALQCFDLAFIDADKPGYGHYLECGLELIRPGGLMIFDNVFMRGDVVRDAPKGKYTASVQAFNEKLQADQRVDISTLPVGDGITLARIKTVI